MKALAILLAIVVSSFTGCDKLDIASGTPRCVEKKIKDYNETSSCYNASVQEYTFQGKTVYVFEPGTCSADMTSELIDSDCNTLGHLGGIAGNIQINGEEFSSATFIRKVWQK
ncbi:MAG: hypothetical protein SH856_14750 [Flavobacteriales bacterium]|nr:hypothetical protein [Flavobacteriales bacterium]